jgi:hypothetical protein
VSLCQSGQAALELIQNYASDLAGHDWSAAREIYARLLPDAKLAAGYGDLHASTVVVTAEGENGADVVLNGAYVAWEKVDGLPRTSTGQGIMQDRLEVGFAQRL